ncbi:MAG: UDP-N-acetylglucosamine--N-acetylmuramyl-(pentapeptide) pyrophosphoryl-undecaprenol N-acetylglucosamine transferase, partial [bacterium]
WGSLGASVMNDMMAEIIVKNAETRAFRHIHATGGGEEGLHKMQERLRRLGLRETPPNLDLRPYISDMGLVMTAADLILCRAGASTLAELTNVGRASILVPSPNVTANQQEKNAAAVQAQGGARMLREAECSAGRLYDEITALLGDRARLTAMEKASRAAGNPAARERIAELVVGMLK